MKTQIRILLLLFASQVFIPLTFINAASLTLPERQGPAGSVVQVPVNISDAAGLAGAEIVLEFDDDILEFVKVDSSGLAVDFYLVANNEPGKIAVSLARATGMQESKGVLFGMAFRIRRSVPVATATEITWTTVNLYDENLESMDVDFEHGVIKVASGTIVYPNPFTPNDDGYNDTAVFVVPESAGEITIKIFSISGNRVAELSSINNALEWDGVDGNGNSLKPGPYIYLVQADGKEISKGTITIMR